MTLSEMAADVYRRLNKATSPDTATETRIRAFLNQRHREVLSIPDCQQLRDDVISFATVANQYIYGLPQAVSRVHRMWDAANERTLVERSMDWFRAMAPDPTAATGSPEVFVVSGQARVAVQPSAAATLADASSLWIKSTSASDTAVARIEGTIFGGYRQVANVTMTGTTAVQLGTLATWIAVTNVYLSSAAVGTVTLHEDSGGGAELARISIGATMPRYWQVYLWPTPAEAITLSLDYAREVSDMSQANDEPLIPVDFHRMLVYGACMDECLKLDDQRYSAFEREWEKTKAAMVYGLHARASWRPGARAVRGASNLGSAFPAGRW